KRTTACHIDIPLRNCTVSLDGRAVVRDGKVLDGGVGEYE
ncbi:MAG TPA: 2,5-dihydroxypyridine 5,6-dioxygenase, partial [Alcaligenes faecalis]|nr:2,5-dihydroxypyridine 5,6-dioxygenase [Alcaligenes faecalis]